MERTFLLGIYFVSDMVLYLAHLLTHSILLLFRKKKDIVREYQMSHRHIDKWQKWIEVPNLPSLNQECL